MAALINVSSGNLHADGTLRLHRGFVLLCNLQLAFKADEQIMYSGRHSYWFAKVIGNALSPPKQFSVRNDLTSTEGQHPQSRGPRSVVMLYLVGLGLADEKDITVKGLEVVKRAERVYLEAYTAVLLVDHTRLVRSTLETTHD